MSDQKMQEFRLLRFVSGKLRDGFARLNSARHIQPYTRSYTLTVLFGVSLAGTAYAASVMPHDATMPSQRLATLQLTAAEPSGPSTQETTKSTPRFTEQAMPEMPGELPTSESAGLVSLDDGRFAGIDPIITGPSSHTRMQNRHWLR